RNSETYFSLYVRLVSGEFDDQLQWPCPWRQVTFQVLDQNPHMQRRMSYERSVTTDPGLFTGKKFFWDNPRHNGTKTKIGNETVFVTDGYGYEYFMYKSELTKREFINGEEIIFLFSMQDTSGLLQNNSVSCPNVRVKRIRNESASSGRTPPSFLILLSATTAPLRASLFLCHIYVGTRSGMPARSVLRMRIMT
ncbi:putative meprin A subunit beta-like, partial [Triplophysa rosa]